MIYTSYIMKYNYIIPEILLQFPKYVLIISWSLVSEYLNTCRGIQILTKPSEYLNESNILFQFYCTNHMHSRAHVVPPWCGV